MNEAKLTELLSQLAAGEMAVPDALKALRQAPPSELSFACLDHHRELRCGFPEVVFGAGKTPEQVSAIVKEFSSQGSNVLVTRLSADSAAQVLRTAPQATYDPAARTLTLLLAPPAPRAGTVAIITGGTSDEPVAAEAACTLRFLGVEPALIQDVGVAGIHRLLRHQAALLEYDVLIVVAGMEGALPSVVGGLFSAPVIAVPTSVGYGANLSGLTPLLAMVNSCASGITVTNIDNGYGAACATIRILSLLNAHDGHRSPEKTPMSATEGA